jgi:DNA-binding ferritin-like protein
MNDAEMPSADQHRRAMAEAFGHVLGNNCRLFRTALCCSWNVRGRDALAAGAAFRAQADEMYAAQDQIAARLRFAGAAVVPDDSETIIVPRPAAADFDAMSAIEMAQLLATGHEGAILSIQAASDVAREVDDDGSMVVLGQRLVAHQTHWIALTAFIGARVN